MGKKTLSNVHGCAFPGTVVAQQCGHFADMEVNVQVVDHHPEKNIKLINYEAAYLCKIGP